MKRAHNRDLYLSFVNFSSFGHEGGAFGQRARGLEWRLGPSACRRTIDALIASGVHHPYPVRAVVRPIQAKCALAAVHGASPAERGVAVPQWRHLAIMIGGFRIAALSLHGRTRDARSSSCSSRARVRSTSGRSPSGCTDEMCATLRKRHAWAVVERRGVPLRGARRCRDASTQAQRSTLEPLQHAVIFTAPLLRSQLSADSIRRAVVECEAAPLTVAKADRNVFNSR